MKFLLALLATAGILFIAYWQLSSPLPSFFYETMVLLLLGTGGLYFYLADIKKERPEYFIQLYIATLFAKMIAYAGYVFFMVWDDKQNAHANALFFMITYLLFTAVEVYFLYRKVNA